MLILFCIARLQPNLFRLLYEEVLRKKGRKRSRRRRRKRRRRKVLLSDSLINSSRALHLVHNFSALRVGTHSRSIQVSLVYTVCMEQSLLYAYRIHHTVWWVSDFEQCNKNWSHLFYAYPLVNQISISKKKKKERKSDLSLSFLL